MYLATVPASPWRAISVENMASLVVPMNCSFSARVSLGPDRSSRSDRTAKCSGSLSMSTPSMSKMTASNRAIQLAREGANAQHDRGAGGRQQHQLQACTRTVVVRLWQQMARTDRQEYAGERGQQKAEDRGVQLGERTNCCADRRRGGVGDPTHARQAQPRL